MGIASGSLALFLTAAAGAAQAASIVSLPAATGNGPSILRLQASPAAPSIVARGDWQQVDRDPVAAVDTPPSGPPNQLPMVIRGGLVGDAFASPDNPPTVNGQPIPRAPTAPMAPVVAAGGAAPQPSGQAPGPEILKRDATPPAQPDRGAGQ
ncbi:MAG: hypothetical protein ABWZ57_08915 [Mesorhizobium sp.]